MMTLQRLVPRHVQWWRRSRYHRNQRRQPTFAAKMVVQPDLTVAANFDPKTWRWTWNLVRIVFKMMKWFEKWLQMMKTLAIWFFRGNIVECTGPPIQKQQSETVTHFELQYVLGTPLAANQQLAISTERNATSLHRIENQCASNKRFTEVGTFAAVMWSSLLLGHLFEPKARNNNHQFPIRLDLLHPEYSWIQKKMHR